MMVLKQVTLTGHTLLYEGMLNAKKFQCHVSFIRLVTIIVFTCLGPLVKNTC